jgi:hypothetical protein
LQRLRRENRRQMEAHGTIAQSFPVRMTSEKVLFVGHDRDRKAGVIAGDRPALSRRTC